MKKICLLMIVLSICSSLIYMGDIIITIIFFTGLIVTGIRLYRGLDFVIRKIGDKIYENKNRN